MANFEPARNNPSSTDWMEQEGEMHDAVTDSRELAAGLLFLLKEYYIGSFELNEGKIAVKFNGQKPQAKGICMTPNMI